MVLIKAGRQGSLWNYGKNQENGLLITCIVIQDDLFWEKTLFLITVAKQ
jgi:hypothetical protein